jgi:hypothetical protein
MFKLHRHRASDRGSVGERFEFRFSSFRAVQVRPPDSSSSSPLSSRLSFHCAARAVLILAAAPAAAAFRGNLLWS